MNYCLPDFLPAPLCLEPGSPSDYRQLESFHYLPGRPATWADVWRIRYLAPAHARVVAVGVLSYPRANCRLREAALGLQNTSTRERLLFVNAHVRAISRVVVHPQFRALGLSTQLVRCLIDHCPTRYVEAIAMMARAHPFFERAGMSRFDSPDPDAPAYLLYDRQGPLPRTCAA